MTGEILPILEALKTLESLARNSEDARARAVIEAAVFTIRLNNLVARTAAYEASVENAFLAERVNELQQQVQELQDWPAQARDYALAEVGYRSFAFVYQPAAAAGTPEHWLCTTCFGRQRKSVLQLAQQAEQQRLAYVCPACGTSITPIRDRELVPPGTAAGL
jgi:hypothetical protein